jgi:hypothetical protein
MNLVRDAPVKEKLGVGLVMRSATGSGEFIVAPLQVDLLRSYSSSKQIADKVRRRTIVGVNRKAQERQKLSSYGAVLS